MKFLQFTSIKELLWLMEIRQKTLKTFKNPDFLGILFQGNKMTISALVRYAYKKITEKGKFAVLAKKKG